MTIATWFPNGPRRNRYPNKPNRRKGQDLKEIKAKSQLRSHSDLTTSKREQKKKQEDREASKYAGRHGSMYMYRSSAQNRPGYKIGG